VPGDHLGQLREVPPTHEGRGTDAVLTIMAAVVDVPPLSTTPNAYGPSLASAPRTQWADVSDAP
jgi:hypothetical protein